MSTTVLNNLLSHIKSEDEAYFRKQGQCHKELVGLKTYPYCYPESQIVFMHVIFENKKAFITTF